MTATFDPHEPGPTDQILDLGLRLVAYAERGKNNPGHPQRAEETRWLLADLSRARDGASDQIKDELRRSIIGMRLEGWTVKNIAALLDYKAVSRIDQLLKGYSGSDYLKQRHAGTSIKALRDGR